MSSQAAAGGAATLFWFGDDWWQRGVVYQVYPRSFADSNGDGVGDLAGLIAHLDHLNDGTSRSLGVDAIWLSPIYPSPGLDGGYDVADYTGVDPLFGTLEDLDRLVTECHRRGIRVILDLVMNHTSDVHPWFVASRAGRHGERADWYIWRDPNGFDRRGRPRPPNNWVSFFGGSAWAWDERRGQFYLHTFLPEQPDLNWRNPEVRAAMLDVVRFWLGRGVDGFRLDVFNAFFKHPDLPSNPRQPGRTAWGRQQHVHDKDQPELRVFLAEFRRLIDEQPGRMTVGELFEGPPSLAASYAAPRHLVFDFRLAEQPWSATAFARAIDEREAAFGPGRWPTVVLSNHDRSRHVSRYRRWGNDPDAIARAAALILLTLRGTPFLYYGEEIAMPDVAIPTGGVVDTAARRRGLVRRIVDPWFNRAQARAPMPWDDGPNGGFTSGDPWLPLPADHARRNVARQAADPDSVMAFYRQLLWLRKGLPALTGGTFRRVRVDHRDILAYIREDVSQRLLVVVHFGRRPATVRLETGSTSGRWRWLFGTHRVPQEQLIDGEPVRLRPLEAAIFVES